MSTFWRRARVGSHVKSPALCRKAVAITVLLLFFAAAIGALLASPPPAGAAASDYWYAGGWPLQDRASHFDYVYNVARDPSGNVFVSDQYNNTVQKFDAGGRLLQTWGSIDDWGMFFAPRGLACDAAGNLYVADRNNVRILKLSTSGVWSIFYAPTGAFYCPLDVACDPAGNVYAIESIIMTNQIAIMKLSPSGSYVLSWGWGGYGSGNGAFGREPQGIACDTNGHVYVADTSNNLIQKFDSEGHFLLQWGTGLDKPAGLTCDSAGMVIVADTGNNRLTEFTYEGTLLFHIGDPGSGPAQFNKPTDVAYGPASTIWVADTNNQRLQRFARDTTAPTTTATCQPAGWTVAFVTVTLAATDDLSGVQGTVYRIGSGAWTPYTGPFVIDAVGSTPVSFHSTDVAGKVEADKTVTASIDREGPVTKALTRVTVKRGKMAAFRFKITDLTPTAGVTIRIFKGSALRKTLAVGSKATGSTQSYTWKCKLAAGTYTWRVYATDLAGNPQHVAGKKTLVVR